MGTNSNNEVLYVINMSMNTIANSMTNWLCNPRGLIKPNLRAYLQRYAVFGYERMVKHLMSNTNSMVL
jgi:hypothetical protein